MDEKLLRFFKLINFNDVLSFEDAKLKDMVVNRRENSWTLRIMAPNIIPVNSMLRLKTLCAEGVDEVDKIYIEMLYDAFDSELVMEYFLYYLDKTIEDNQSLSAINKDLIKID